MFSHKYQGLYSDRCRAAEQSGLEAVFRDSKGVIRWRSNGLPVPPAVVRIAGFYPEKVRDENPCILGVIARLNDPKWDLRTLGA